MKKSKTSGFTLIELMIVVAIIGILAAIAIPNFVRYQLKSKEAESKTVIGGIKTSQEAFRAEFDQYVAVAAPQGGNMLTEKAPWTNPICDPGCTRAMVALCSEFSCIGYLPAGPTYFAYSTAITAAGVPDWTVTAAGDLDGDGMANVWGYGTDNVTPPTGMANAGEPVGGTIALVPGEAMKVVASDLF